MSRQINIISHGASIHVYNCSHNFIGIISQHETTLSMTEVTMTTIDLDGPFVNIGVQLNKCHFKSSGPIHKLHMSQMYGCYVDLQNSEESCNLSLCFSERTTFNIHIPATIRMINIVAWSHIIFAKPAVINDQCTFNIEYTRCYFAFGLLCASLMPMHVLSSIEAEDKIFTLLGMHKLDPTSYNLLYQNLNIGHAYHKK